MGGGVRGRLGRLADLSPPPPGVRKGAGRRAEREVGEGRRVRRGRGWGNGRPGVDRHIGCSALFPFLAHLAAGGFLLVLLLVFHLLASSLVLSKLQRGSVPSTVPEAQYVSLICSE